MSNEQKPGTKDDEQIRQRARELFAPMKLEKVQEELDSHGAEKHLTEEEVACAAAACKHAYQSVAVSFMISVVAAAVAFAAGVSALVGPQELTGAGWLFVGVMILGAGIMVFLSRRDVWHVGVTAAVREVLTMRREAGTLTICLTRESS